MTILKEGKKLTPTQVAKLQIQDALFQRLDNVGTRIQEDLDGSGFGDTPEWTNTEMKLCQEAYVRQMNRVLKMMSIEKDSYPIVDEEYARY
tara:strand:- start:3171 stop:3443 length:273 start_codon:yes stop_codon:yes gene_type:complete